jgi:hypothetical protein
MRPETKPFYVGVRPCGCITAAMIDDDTTTPDEIAEFARDMAKSGRRVEHRSLTQEEFQRTFVQCKCTGNAP